MTPNEKPILFSSPMIRALLEGRKSQTRRVVKPQPEMVAFAGDPVPAFVPPLCCPGMLAVGVSVFNAGGNDGLVKCPYGHPGDRLWVRETFYCDHGDYPNGSVVEMKSLLEYRADHDCANWEAGCPCHDENGRSSWRPSIFMPRWASRLTLEITAVRVERVQEITAADATAEGILVDDRQLRETPNFRELWDSLNKARGFGWESNPWVWCITFKIA